MWVFMKNVMIICIFLDVSVFAKIMYNTFPPAPAKNESAVKLKVNQLTCLLRPEVGPCRAHKIMYYFRPMSLGCYKFNWGGCQGNGNRFNTAEECMKTCLGKSNDPHERPNLCKFSFDYGFCFGDVKRYYYDDLWKVCRPTIYSGCGGNANNFHSLVDCENICRFNNNKPRIFQVHDKNSPANYI